jgi:hypothetical protein
MPALYPLAATPAPAYMNTEFDPFHLGLWYLSLILPLDLDLFQFAAAAQTTSRQFSFQRLLNRGGNRTATTAAIPGPCFPPRRGGMGLWCAPRERRRLTFPRPLRFFQSA